MLAYLIDARSNAGRNRHASGARGARRGRRRVVAGQRRSASRRRLPPRSCGAARCRPRRRPQATRRRRRGVRSTSASAPRRRPPVSALSASSRVRSLPDADELFRACRGSPPADRFDLRRKDGRRACRERWEGWWKLNREKLDLSAWSKGPGLLGRTIICESADPEGQSRVWECAANGKTRWKIPMRNPIDVQMLPEGRVLVADCIQEGQVVELERRGRVGG